MKRFFKNLKNLYLKPRWFILLGAIVLLFVFSFFFEFLYGWAKIAFYIFLVLNGVDLVLLYHRKNAADAERIAPNKLSNGDKNPIELIVKNQTVVPYHFRIIDELPVQFQRRDFQKEISLKPNAKKTLQYEVRPVKRGEYIFRSINVFISSDLGLLERRMRFGEPINIPTYPSYLQLRKYSLLAMSNRLHEYGLKKIRRIGHTMEFEQIKEYVRGDDIRNINWKATAKRNRLMVNQYQDEKAQPVYSVIDMGRVMELPFEGMSLLDYAINATLVISNIALLKQDKAGMFTFNRKVDNVIAAERRPSQMNLILEKLYALQTDFAESDFARLYTDTKRLLNQRSLLLLYTNFETMDALHRQLPYLQAMAKNHLLVVIFFENTELMSLLKHKAEDTQEIYDKTIAEKFVYEKKLIVKELQKHGIQTILTKPQNLTVNTINKYLEIKARGLI